MLKNLRKLLDDRHMSTKDFSIILGVAEKTAYNKIVEESEFTLGEAKKVKLLFPEYSMSYLFESDSRVQKTPTNPNER